MHSWLLQMTKFCVKAKDDDRIGRYDKVVQRVVIAVINQIYNS